MKTIATPKAPAAIGPYSQGKVVGNLVFFSGQIALDPATGEVKGTTIEEQTKCICENIGELLKEAGCTYDSVVKTTCFLADIADFATFNQVYGKYITSAPARSCVAVKALPKGALVEVEIIAVAEQI